MGATFTEPPRDFGTSDGGASRYVKQLVCPGAASPERAKKYQRLAPEHLRRERHRRPVGGRADLRRQLDAGTPAVHVVEIDSRTGEPVRHEVIGSPIQVSDAMVGHIIGRWIQWTRGKSIDPVVLEDNWKRAYQFVPGTAKPQIDAYAREIDAFNPDKVGKEAVTVEIVSVTRQSPDTFQVRWHETAFEGGHQSGRAKLHRQCHDRFPEADHAATNSGQSARADDHADLRPARLHQGGERVMTSVIPTRLTRQHVIPVAVFGLVAACAHDQQPTSFVRAVPQEPPRIEATIEPAAFPSFPQKLKPLAPNDWSEPQPSGLAAIKAAHEEALIASAPDGFINATQFFPYESGALYEMHAAPGFLSTIQLQPGETLVNYAAGDTARWVIGDVTEGERTQLLVKPTRPNLSTNLVITTDKRVYLVEAKSHTRDTYNAVIAWTYPFEEISQQVAAIDAENQRRDNTIVANVPVDQLDFDYGIDGDQAKLAADSCFRRWCQGLHRVPARPRHDRSSAALFDRRRRQRSAGQLPGQAELLRGRSPVQRRRASPR